jgi:hypothetical protein
MDREVKWLHRIEGIRYSQWLAKRTIHIRTAAGVRCFRFEIMYRTRNILAS